MATILLLACSLSLQVAAAGLALIQIREAKHAWAWWCVAGALILMSLRRGVTLTRVISEPDSYTADPVAETVALIISLLMFAGVLGFRTLLGSIRKETQSAVNKGKDIFKGYLDMPFVGLAIASPSQNWLEFNNRLCSIFGYSRDELKLIPWPNLLHPHDRAHDSELFHEILKKKRDHYSTALRFIRKDGDIAHTNLVVQSVRRHDGTIEFLRVIVQDITKERRAEQELIKAKERFEGLVVNMNEGLAELDARGCYVFVNRSFCEKLEYNESELIGRNVLDTFDDDFKPVFEKQFEQRKLGGKTPYEAIFRSKSGKPLYTRVAPQPLFTDGEFSGTYAVITDLSQRKEVENRLEEANQAFMEADRQKNQFLSSMNHELRTPLTSILGFADILLRRKDELTEKQGKYLNNIRSSGQHLLALINDMLDIAKIDAGMDQLVWEELDVKEVVENALNLMTPQAGDKNQIMETDLDENIPALTADSRRLKQILFNLLSNAVKYTPERGTITVRTRTEDERIIFSVIDTGPGIKKEDQELIFDEFKQAEAARDSALGGIGIGLALTRRLVLLHGGLMGVDSEEGQGSTFWFTLPVHKEPPGEPGESGENSTVHETPVTGKRILVVEDHEHNIAILQDMLEMHHHQVYVATNGHDAIELAESTLPELIFMDIQLPGMDGMQITRKLRDQSEFLNVPIIATTASVGEDAREECMESGFTDFLAKPIVFEELTTMIHKHLNSK